MHTDAKTKERKKRQYKKKHVKSCNGDTTVKRKRTSVKTSQPSLTVTTQKGTQLSNEEVTDFLDFLWMEPAVVQNV